MVVPVDKIVDKWGVNVDKLKGKRRIDRKRNSSEPPLPVVFGNVLSNACLERTFLCRCKTLKLLKQHAHRVSGLACGLLCGGLLHNNFG